jgi:hypothetical protein
MAYHPQHDDSWVAYQSAHIRFDWNVSSPQLSFWNDVGYLFAYTPLVQTQDRLARNPDG